LQGLVGLVGPVRQVALWWWRRPAWRFGVAAPPGPGPERHQGTGARRGRQGFGESLWI